MKYNLDQFILHFPEEANYSFQPHLFDLLLVKDTQRAWHLNGLYQSLSLLIGAGPALRQMLLYNLGTSRWFGGANISWQQKDRSKNYFVGGFVERFNPVTGLADDSTFTTVHDIFLDQFSIDVGTPPVPGLFGGHLLSANLNKRVVICCNPITALVCSYYFDQFNWLATSSHLLTDLNATLTALSISAPTLLLAELGYEQEWSYNISVFNTFLKSPERPALHLLCMSSVQGSSILASQWINEHQSEAVRSIERAFI